MMFASKTGRDLNHDPEPWLHYNPMLPGGPVRVPRGCPKCSHQPRPEFDHVQLNKPNLYLTDYRSIADRMSYEAAVFWLSYYPDDEDEVHHARKVLTRLAALDHVSR